MVEHESEKLGVVGSNPTLTTTSFLQGTHTLQTFKQLAEAIRGGLRPTVQFYSKVEDLESYPENNMRATITGVEDSHDGVIKLRVSYAKYDEYNKQFESHNYYDRSGRACLNAREAGNYKVEDELYVMGDDRVETYMKIISDELQEKYRAQVLQPGATMITYVEWLEQQLRSYRQRMANHDKLVEMLTRQ